MIKRPFSLFESDIRGMTVVEVLMVAGLVLVVVAAGIAPFVIQQDFLKAQFNRNRLQDEASVAMSYITRDIFAAKNADLSNENNGTGTYRTLTLTVGTGPLRSNEQRVTYDRDADDNTITRAVGDGDAEPIAGHISALQFDRTGTENFYLTIIITAQEGGQTITIESGTALRAIRPA